MGTEASALARILRAACCDVSTSVTRKGAQADLSLVVSLTLDLSLLLESVDDILVTPSDLVRDSLQGAVFSSRLESQDSESGRDNDSLDLVLCWWDTLEEFKSFQGGGTSGSLVGNHSSDGLVQDPRGGSEVEWTSSGGVDNVSL